MTLEIVDLSANPPQVKQGQSSVVTVLLKNTGIKIATFTCRLECGLMGLFPGNPNVFSWGNTVRTVEVQNLAPDQTIEISTVGLDIQAVPAPIRWVARAILYTDNVNQPFAEKKVDPIWQVTA